MKIIGEAYRELQNLVKLYAKEDLPVLFYGETGTGKELFMRFYMDESVRHGKKMTINCAAVSDSLLRSEVFGHERGAFTGADRKRLGKIAACNKGILALDEIGDATPEFQAAILRVSEANSYSPLGGDVEIEANTLIIGATNNLEKVRHDLKERFHILPIPPLQKEDIPALASHFLKKTLTEEVIQELTCREYPGNIRELKRVCERLRTERGAKLFSKKKNAISLSNFDYHRFRRELNTWNKYIQPLIDYYGKEHGFEKYRYKYMPWDGDSLEWILNRDESLNPSVADNEISGTDYDALANASNQYVFICYLKKCIGEEDDLPLREKEEFLSERMNPNSAIKEFKNYMRDIFDYSTLPCLLGYIYLKAEGSTAASTPIIREPHLAYLLL